MVEKQPRTNIIILKRAKSAIFKSVGVLLPQNYSSPLKIVTTLAHLLPHSSWKNYLSFRRIILNEIISKSRFANDYSCLPLLFFNLDCCFIQMPVRRYKSMMRAWLQVEQRRLMFMDNAITDKLSEEKFWLLLIRKKSLIKWFWARKILVAEPWLEQNNGKEKITMLREVFIPESRSSQMLLHLCTDNSENTPTITKISQEILNCIKNFDILFLQNFLSIRRASEMHWQEFFEMLGDFSKFSEICVQVHIDMGHIWEISNQNLRR